MTQTVLGADRAVFQKNMGKNILFCIFAFCAIVLMHLICTCLRTEHNHTAMLIANIAVDISGGSFIIARLNICVFPQQKLLKLYDLATQETSGQVLEIGKNLIHYIGVDCYEICLPDRHLFLPARTMVLTQGESYRFRLKGNLIVEVNSNG